MRLVLLQTTPGIFVVADKRDESRCVSEARPTQFANCCATVPVFIALILVQYLVSSD